VVIILFTNLIYLSSSFTKLYERDIDFINNVIIILLNEEIDKIKVIDLEKLYNFIVENFLFELIYYFKMCFEVLFTEC